MLNTEQRNLKTMALDQMTRVDLLKVMNQEDQMVPKEIGLHLEAIGQMIEGVVKAFKDGGRLIYIGAGTSGRMGLIDAVECVPTFGTSKELVQGLIAGGQEAFVEAVEGAEDQENLGREDLMAIDLTEKDVVIGIAASGRTPYVIGGLKYAEFVGAQTMSVACNKKAIISQYASVALEIEVGPEVLTGSTRLKAGTAQKLVLNMISTCAMVEIGKTYQNLMVDVIPSNKKLIERSKRIIMAATDVSYDIAADYYERSHGHAKTAIVMILTGKSFDETTAALQQGFVSKAIEALS